MERETAVPTHQVEEAEKVIKQEQEDIRNADRAGLTTRKS